jgi:hypothetical protein
MEYPRAACEPRRNDQSVGTEYPVNADSGQRVLGPEAAENELFAMRTVALRSR